MAGQLEKLALKEANLKHSCKEDAAPNKQFPLIWLALEILYKMISRKIEKKQAKKADKPKNK